MDGRGFRTFLVTVSPGTPGQHASADSELPVTVAGGGPGQAGQAGPASDCEQQFSRF